MELAIEIPNSFLLADGAEKRLSHSGLIAGQNLGQEIGQDAGQIQDHTLLAAFEHGNREAFTTLYKRHSRAVFQFAFYMAGDADMADELTQKVFVWLIEHPAAFKPERGSLPAFLGGVARKMLRRQLRYESRWAPLEDALEMIHAVVFAHSPTVSVEAALDAAQLRQAIALLPVRYREVVVLCDLQEKEYVEAARILDCSIGTVRSRLHRGRNLLARKLNPKLTSTTPNSRGSRHGL